MIYEYDVPPQAYFEVQGTEGGPISRFVHKAFCTSTQKVMEDFIESVRHRLNQEGEEVCKFIFWRQRPKYSEDIVPEAYCRFSTSPPIPSEWYSQQGFTLSKYNQWRK